MFRNAKLALIVSVLASVSAVAYAAKAIENDALSITKAKVPMAQAITAAEQHANGKAARAEYEQTNGEWAYDVEVVSGNKVFDVKINAEKGTVISSIEDKTELDDDHDKQD